MYQDFSNDQQLSYPQLSLDRVIALVNGFLEEFVLGEQRPHPRLQLVVVQLKVGLAGEKTVDGYVVAGNTTWVNDRWRGSLC